MTAPDDPIVTMRHVRAAKLCSRGARTLAARHGLDWTRFVREGLPASLVEATGDAFALRVAAAARKEAARG